MNVPKVGNHFEEIIDSSNISYAGLYNWLVICNTSTEGGFVAETFEVTRNGRDIVSDQLPTGIMLGVLAIIVIYFIILVKLFAEREFTEHGFVRMLFFIIAFWVVLIPLNILVLFNEFYNGSVQITTMLELLYQIIILTEAL